MEFVQQRVPGGGSEKKKVERDLIEIRRVSHMEALLNDRDDDLAARSLINFLTTLQDEGYLKQRNIFLKTFALIFYRIFIGGLNQKRPWVETCKRSLLFKLIQPTRGLLFAVTFHPGSFVKNTEAELPVHVLPAKARFLVKTARYNNLSDMWRFQIESITRKNTVALNAKDCYFVCFSYYYSNAVAQKQKKPIAPSSRGGSSWKTKPSEPTTQNIQEQLFAEHLKYFIRWHKDNSEVDMRFLWTLCEYLFTTHFAEQYEYSRPSDVVLDAIEMLIKHLRKMTVNDENPPCDEMKRMRRYVFDYISLAFRRFPVDCLDIFPKVVDIWFLWMQPWTKLNNIDDYDLQRAVYHNYFFYTNVMDDFLKMAANLDFTTSRDIKLLLRALSFFGERITLAMKDVERVLNKERKGIQTEDYDFIELFNHFGLTPRDYVCPFNYSSSRKDVFDIILEVARQVLSGIVLLDKRVESGIVKAKRQKPKGKRLGGIWPMQQATEEKEPQEWKDLQRAERCITMLEVLFNNNEKLPVDYRHRADAERTSESFSPLSVKYEGDIWDMPLQSCEIGVFVSCLRVLALWLRAKVGVNWNFRPLADKRCVAWVLFVSLLIFITTRIFS